MPGTIQTNRMFDVREMRSTAGFTSHMEIVTPGLIRTLWIFDVMKMANGSQILAAILKLFCQVGVARGQNDCYIQQPFGRLNARNDTNVSDV